MQIKEIIERKRLFNLVMRLVYGSQTTYVLILSTNNNPTSDLGTLVDRIEMRSQVLYDFGKDLWCLTPFSTVFQLLVYRGGQGTHPSFPGILLTSTPQDILSKPLAAFPYTKHRRNDGQLWFWGLFC